MVNPNILLGGNAGEAQKQQMVLAHNIISLAAKVYEHLAVMDFMRANNVLQERHKAWTISGTDEDPEPRQLEMDGSLPMVALQYAQQFFTVLNTVSPFPED